MFLFYAWFVRIRATLIHLAENYSIFSCVEMAPGGNVQRGDVKVKGLSGKEKRHHKAALRAYDRSVGPAFLDTFPVSCHDLVRAKLSFYHIRLGTRMFNQIEDVMLIHLVECSSICSIPEITRHGGKSSFIYPTGSTFLSCIVSFSSFPGKCNVITACGFVRPLALGRANVRDAGGSILTSSEGREP